MHQYAPSRTKTTIGLCQGKIGIENYTIYTIIGALKRLFVVFTKFVLYYHLTSPYCCARNIDTSIMRNHLENQLPFMAAFHRRSLGKGGDLSINRHKKNKKQLFYSKTNEKLNKK
ncbi:MAG: hypothetical protein DYG84_15240 [Candidatus Brocadia sp. AMX3]|nr:hypothetical protein [Candidatus Brocadia sp. AMX3]OQZ03143.1 MAG: hypothetical protein B6D35_00160 [Candidatus Brocadia sp. UTAMX2]